MQVTGDGAWPYGAGLRLREADAAGCTARQAREIDVS